MTTLPCSACGKLYLRYKSSMYCSDDCRKKNRTLKAHDQNHKSKLKNFGITVEDYEFMFERQGGTCAICGSPETEFVMGVKKRLSVDHCHQTGRVRGLLCSKCNLGLGYFLDNWVLIDNAMEYLIAYDSANLITTRAGTRDDNT